MNGINKDSIVVDISNHITIKIVVVGDASVGKTSLVNVLCDREFDESTEPTLCALMNYPTFSGMRIQLWDTAGQEKYRALMPIYYRGADMVILCCNYDNKDPGAYFDKWMDEINAFNSEIPEVARFEVIKVITKMDLKDQIINTLISNEWIHTSAKTGEGINILKDYIESRSSEIIKNAFTNTDSVSVSTSSVTRKCC